MSKMVEFFFDMGSPAAYLAWTQLPALCAAQGAQLHYRPMLLGAVFQATGNSSPAMVAAKGAYMKRDLLRFADRYGVPMRFNPHFPINTLFLMRVVTGALQQAPERLPQVLQAIFEAAWVHERNLNDESVTAQVLAQAGVPAEQALAWAGDPAVKAALKATTQEAVKRGVFGAPSYVVDGELYFGQDRLDFVREALQAA